ncbi:hypothetical protein EW146_g2777 [Bondarzewia mesenterica]|uniref:AB hydrolase-1 domain-containing protein n=1 Tax=Bondarzewia mesenterica TaxID=1095465 RepID=A0A4S4LZJ8_9AGAM|nr:hypothetical protein EW146_g2777 [Bondarzewia mesenterica]
MGSVLSLRSCTPREYWASTLQYVRAKKQGNPGEVETTSFRAFVETRCPSLLEEFHPAWWLFNGHLQTAYAAVGNFLNVDKVVYDRKLLRLKDGGTIGLDFTPPIAERILDEETPIVVVLHGLTGGSHESYVRAILNPAVTPKEEGGIGYRGVVVNFRGCAGVQLTTPYLYSAGHTDDIRQALMYLSHLYPKAPLLGVGFSLGAGILTKYLAQEGEHSRLTSGCAFGCPWDLSANNDILENGLIQRNVYSKGMGQNLQRLVIKHLDTISKFPDSTLARVVPDLVSKKHPTILEFDSLVTCVAGGAYAPFPFPDAYSYYRWGSSHKALKDIRVPFLAVNAGDDPIVQALPLDAGDNGWVAMVVTPGGGHLGWFESVGYMSTEVQRWIRKPVLEWLRSCAEDLIADTSKRRQLKEVDGFLVEEGQEHLGCREIEGGGKVVGAERQEGLIQGL